MRAQARVVDDNVGRARLGLDRLEKTRDGRRIGGINGVGRAPVSASKGANFSTSRAARVTRSPAAASIRATEALMPGPAPMIRALS